MSGALLELYQKDGSTKIGDLFDTLSAIVTEERNGIFELEFNYPNEFPYSDQVISENFVKCKPNDTQDPQKFRIYSVKQIMKNTLTVRARHESYDLASDHIGKLDLKGASCEYALNEIFRNSFFSTDFRGYSDIVNAQDYFIENINPLNAIAGKEGSIIDTFGTGAEIYRNNKEFHVLNKRGHDNGVTIEYGKNLTDFVLDVDLSNLETRVGGFAKYRGSDGQDVIVYSDWIDSPFVGNFAHPYINPAGRRDYSSQFDEKNRPTREALNALCTDEFKINKRDLPSNKYTLKFVPLSKCVGYEATQDAIGLCDVVRVVDPRFKLDTKVKVVKYVYDVLKQRYDSMELGEPRTTLGNVLGGNTSKPPELTEEDVKDIINSSPGKDFPNTLPNTPVLTAKLRGLSSIELSWTFDNKPYYQYELYASKDKGFTPNIFDIIHRGQSSSFIFEAKPGETWYFRVCGANSHNERTSFSDEVEVVALKGENLDAYFSEVGIGNAVAGAISAGYVEANSIKGNWIDARHLTVTDGNGKRTLDIDSFGRIRANFTSIQLNSEDIVTVPYVDGVKTELAEELKGFEEKITPDALKRVFSTDFYTKDSANSQFTSKTEFEQNNREFLFKIEQTGMPQLIENGALLEGSKFWHGYQAQTVIELIGGLKYISMSPRYEAGWNSFGVRLPQMEVKAGTTYTVGCWVSGNITSLNYNWLMQIKNGAPSGVQRIGNVEFGNVVNEARRVSLTFTSQVSGYVEIALAFEGQMNSGLYFRVAEACCFKGPILFPYAEAGSSVYAGNAYIDRTGMGMKHDDGSISRITSKSFELTDVYERLKMAIKKGTLYAYDVDNGNLLGMFGSNRLNTNYKGVTTGIAGSSHYYAIGVSHELTDTSDLTMKPYMVIAQQDLQNVFGMSRMSAGINFMNTKAIFHEPVHCMRYFAGTGVYSPDSILSLGYTDETANYQTAFAVEGGVKRLKGYMPLDMNGWQIYNASLAYSVVNRNSPMAFKSLKGVEPKDSIFDEIEIVNPSARSFKASMSVESIGELDVTNVTNKDEIMLNEDSADLGKLVTILFKEVKELKEEIKRLKELK